MDVVTCIKTVWRDILEEYQSTRQYVLGYVLGWGSQPTTLFIYEADKLAYKYLIKVNAAARGPCGHASDYLCCTAVAHIPAPPVG